MPVAFCSPGHVEKFADLMVKDTVTGDPYRADKLLEDLIDDLLAKNPKMPEVTECPTVALWSGVLFLISAGFIASMSYRRRQRPSSCVLSSCPKSGFVGPWVGEAGGDRKVTRRHYFSVRRLSVSPK